MKSSCTDEFQNESMCVRMCGVSEDVLISIRMFGCHLGCWDVSRNVLICFRVSGVSQDACMRLDMCGCDQCGMGVFDEVRHFKRIMLGLAIHTRRSFLRVTLLLTFERCGRVSDVSSFDVRTPTPLKKESFPHDYLMPLLPSLAFSGLRAAPCFFLPTDTIVPANRCGPCRLLIFCDWLFCHRVISNFESGPRRQVEHQGHGQRQQKIPKMNAPHIKI